MNQKLPKRHHYLPQFYLKGFSQDKSRLFLYDKMIKDPKLQFPYRTTENIGLENNLYLYTNKSMKKETLEEFFSKIENLAKNVIEKLENRIEITPYERGHLALFVAFLWFRTPSAKKESLNMQEEMTEKLMRMMFSFPEQKTLVKKFLSERGEVKTEDEIDDLIDFVKNPERSRLKMKFPNGYWIKQMLEMANKIYIYLAHCSWEIRHSDKRYAFITCDSPVMLIPSEKPHPFYGIGLLTPGVKKIVTLNSRMCLIMHEPYEELYLNHTPGDKDFVRLINSWQFEEADRFVFSPDKGKIEKMVKLNPDLTKSRCKRYSIS